MSNGREATLGADELAMVRMRAEEAGLQLNDDRLAQLAELLRDFARMMQAIEMIEIDPTDLALEPYDPAWTEGERGR
jgi:hypothetical protein